jgi:lysophospholipase L1-like esterase
MKILFQGDSITDAFRKPDEINPAYQLGNGYVLLIAAQLAARFPEKHWDFVNRGVSGNKILDLKNRWTNDVLAIRPDVLTIFVGVNDTLAAMQGQPSTNEQEFASAYQFLLQETRQHLPDTRFVLMEPFLLEVGEVRKSWCDHLRSRQLLVQAIASETMSDFVPTQQIFDNASKIREPAFWSYDGIHPTHAGFQLLADAWLEVFEKMRL